MLQPTIGTRYRTQIEPRSWPRLVIRNGSGTRPEPILGAFDEVNPHGIAIGIGTYTIVLRNRECPRVRWLSFSIADMKERDFKLDSFKWLKEESLEDADDLPEPEDLATDAIAELHGAVQELNAVLALLENGNKG
jgi:hypothetical protein